jgi:hypothetical protein
LSAVELQLAAEIAVMQLRAWQLWIGDNQAQCFVDEDQSTAVVREVTGDGTTFVAIKWLADEIADDLDAYIQEV